MGAPLFISYSRADIVETDWVARLKMYLAPFGRKGTIDPWDDSRILSGTRWKEEIARALAQAAAAVLVVGPGFLASGFVMEREVPELLRAAYDRGIKLFPLIVGFCGYAESELGGYQAVNSPDQPLESLPRPEQNRTLNALAIEISNSFQEDRSRKPSDEDTTRLYEDVLAIQKHLTDTRTAFVAQSRRRDALVSAIERRLKFTNQLEYEKFFFRYHSQLTDEERFEFDQIRAITEGSIQVGNRRLLEIIEANDLVLGVGPEMTDLRQHLVFWLNKFDRVFTVNRAMCLLYTGVEDGVPFPPGVDAVVGDWLRRNKPEGA